MFFLKNILIFLWSKLFQTHKFIKFLVLTLFQFSFSFTNLDFTTGILVVTILSFFKIIYTFLFLSILLGEKLAKESKFDLFYCNYDKRWKRIGFLFLVWMQIIGNISELMLAFFLLLFMINQKELPNIIINVNHELSIVVSIITFICIIIRSKDLPENT